MLKLLNDNFNTDEQQLFINQFKLYLEYSDDDTKFIIDFDNVYKWLDFKQKKHIQNVYYWINLKNIQKVEKKEQIMLNITTFKNIVWWQEQKNHLKYMIVI